MSVSLPISTQLSSSNELFATGLVRFHGRPDFGAPLGPHKLHTGDGHAHDSNFDANATFFTFNLSRLTGEAATDTASGTDVGDDEFHAVAFTSCHLASNACISSCAA
jgi:hypothetical protein